MRRPSKRLILALAAKQHDVVAMRQLLALGFHRQAIQRLVQAGWLHRLHYGVFAVGRRDLSPAGHRMAAVLACGDGALLSHFAAAAQWGLRQSSRVRIDVNAPGRRSRAKIRVHHAQLHPDDRAIHRRIPLTSPARTLLDCAALVTAAELTRMVEEAERLGLFDLGAIEAVLARNARHRGTEPLRNALRVWTEPPPTRSELERRFLELVAAANLPRPNVNVLVAGLEVDFVWPEAALIVELDGRRYHTAASAFERDRLRDVRLTTAGFRVVRITWRRLHDEPAAVVADLRRLLDVT